MWYGHRSICYVTLIMFNLAISTAYSEADVSHRDVSKSNVMMTESRDGARGGHAVLNDWDHAKRIYAPRVDWVRLRTVRILTSLTT